LHSWNHMFKKCDTITLWENYCWFPIHRAECIWDEVLWGGIVREFFSVWLSGHFRDK
jgi:hypothetical protein